MRTGPSSSGRVIRRRLAPLPHPHPCLPRHPPPRHQRRNAASSPCCSVTWWTPPNSPPARPRRVPGRGPGVSHRLYGGDSPLRRAHCATAGDGLLVYFGYPQAHEDDAQRAVRTGLDILAAMGDLNTHLQQEKGIQLALRMGIHTGQVVVGALGGAGRQEQLALGEVPNIASRIEGFAAPNTVAISDATYRLVQGYFVCQDLGAPALRGITESLQLYQVDGESGATSRLEVVQPRGLTPLVGREQEMGLLVDRWEQAQSGQGQVALLTGDAGIGKSG